IRTGRCLFTLDPPLENPFSVAFSPDGRCIAAGGEKAMQVWESEGGCRAITCEGYRGGAYDVDFSPTGSRVAAPGDDCVVRVWDARTGQEVFALEGHTDVIYGLAFSPDGKRIVSGSNDRTIRVWEVPTELGCLAPNA